ncbi:MAG TPA: hypothetical protein VF062_08305 [Candidatus Limnocylindrales bacterium]
MPDLHAALAVAEAWVGSVEGVVMVGQGRETIDVWVTRDDVDLPDEVLGVPVRVVPTGEIKPH